MTDVQPVPEGFHTVTPHLTVAGGVEALEFYARAFGARELHRQAIEGSDTLMHAQMMIGDSVVMLNDEFPEHGVLAPKDGKGGVTIHLYVEEVDSAWQRAVDAGCTVVFPLNNAFWGDRYGILVDPFGHRWSVASRVEIVAPEEMAARARAAFSGGEC